MKAIFSKEGNRALRLSWAALAIAIAAAVAMGFGSYWYLQKEKRDGVQSARSLQEARASTDAVKREIEDMRTSSKVFQDLLDRGILQDERRLDFIERLDALKVRHRILSLEYDIDPQRPLPLAGGRVFNALEVMGSKVKVRLKALHEGDALAFLEDLAMPARGFHALSKCQLKRVDRVAADVTNARVEAGCTLEWISLKDKGKARAN